jgi:hypothetical protein
MNNYIIKFDYFKKISAAPLLYWILLKIFKPVNINNKYATNQLLFFLFIPEILYFSISSHFQNDNKMFPTIKIEKKKSYI